MEIMFKFEQNPKEKPDYLVGSTWSSLTKSWKKYHEAKEQVDTEKMKLYAHKIQNLQKKLGITLTHFKELS